MRKGETGENEVHESEEKVVETIKYDIFLEFRVDKGGGIMV